MCVSIGTHETNLFQGKSAGFVSVDRFNITDPLFGFETTLHCPNLYHLRQLASIVGLNCLQSKFDLQPQQHYNKGSDDFDEQQVLESVACYMWHDPHDGIFIYCGAAVGK